KNQFPSLDYLISVTLVRGKGTLTSISLCATACCSINRYFISLVTLCHEIWDHNLRAKGLWNEIVLLFPH
ncbi:unnamed protein product, partial [Arabidopsis halleri]